MTNYQALHDEIMARQDLAAYVVTNDMPKQNAVEKDKAIADALNEGQVVVIDVYVDEPQFLDKVGAVEATAILDKLDNLALTNGVLKRAMRSFYSDRGLNFGSEQLRAMIDLLTDDGDPLKLTTTEAQTIKSLAESPRRVTGANVSVALRGNSQFTPE